jgi:hypothetical protein
MQEKNNIVIYFRSWNLESCFSPQPLLPMNADAPGIIACLPHFGGMRM